MKKNYKNNCDLHWEISALRIQSKEKNVLES